MSRQFSSLAAASLIALLSCLACSSGEQRAKVLQPGATLGGGPKAPTSPKVRSGQAKLVLSIVLDQVSSDAILLYAPYLPRDGVIRRAMEEGLFVERARYDYAGTNTAPGHASIYTGEVPADHGIDRNDFYDPKQGKIKIINTGKYPMFGVEGGFASPVRMLKPTIGDKLHDKQPNSKVVSVSLKARAAVVSGGQSPDLVTWYDPRKPGFTTSAFYLDKMPRWIDQWNTKKTILSRMTKWEAGNPELYLQVCGADAAAGEADWYGLGTTFPHNAKDSEKPEKTFMATPDSIDYLLDMTREVVSRYQLGVDEYPDLLMVSVSTTDYAGHNFGMNSWEYLDVLIKADRALGKLVSELEKNTDLAVLITSDHGTTPLAEHSLAAGKPGGRLFGDQMVADLEALADAKLGQKHWFLGNVQPYLYLSAEAYGSDKYQELLQIISVYVAQTPSIEAIIPAAKARGERNSDDWLKRAVANSVSPTSQALFVVPAKGYITSTSSGMLGTGHGTPWDTDRDVAVLAFGTGVHKAHSSVVVNQQRVAPTIAALLGLHWELSARPLPGSPEIK